MRNRTCTAMIGIALLAAAAAAQTPPCPANFTGYGALAEGQSITCACSAEQTGGGNIWGSDRYTADSSICRAAVHAGVIPAAGGTVKVYAFGACSKFAGSSRHGVQTGDWGGYGASFAFKRNAPCAEDVKIGGLPPCPPNMTGDRGRAPACGLECFCSSAAITGSLWGTGLYTLDSSVCAAARQAGVVPEGGGPVAVFVGGGCSSFSGSESNGVKSGDWGAYDGSFAFAYPLPTCPDGSAPARKP